MTITTFNMSYPFGTAWLPNLPVDCLKLQMGASCHRPVPEEASGQSETQPVNKHKFQRGSYTYVLSLSLSLASCSKAWRRPRVCLKACKSLHTGTTSSLMKVLAQPVFNSESGPLEP